MWKMALSRANMDISKDVNQATTLGGPDWVGGGEGIDTMPLGKY